MIFYIHGSKCADEAKRLERLAGRKVYPLEWDASEPFELNAESMAAAAWNAAECFDVLVGVGIGCAYALKISGDILMPCVAVNPPANPQRDAAALAAPEVLKTWPSELHPAAGLNVPVLALVNKADPDLDAALKVFPVCRIIETDETDPVCIQSILQYENLIGVSPESEE